MTLARLHNILEQQNGDSASWMANVMRLSGPQNEVAFNRELMISPGMHLKVARR